MELLALLFKNLISVFFATRHALKLGQVFTRWKQLFELCMLILKVFELNTEIFQR